MIFLILILAAIIIMVEIDNKKNYSGIRFWSVLWDHNLWKPFFYTASIIHILTLTLNYYALIFGLFGILYQFHRLAKENKRGTSVEEGVFENIARSLGLVLALLFYFN